MVARKCFQRSGMDLEITVCAEIRPDKSIGLRWDVGDSCQTPRPAFRRVPHITTMRQIASSANRSMAALISSSDVMLQSYPRSWMADKGFSRWTLA